MRAVYWKELRELALVGIPLMIGAGFMGWEYSAYGGEIDEILSLVILGGLALGITHGLLDRQRRDDLFLRHRPISHGQLALARTAAGGTVVVLACAVLMISLIWGAAYHARFYERIRQVSEYAARHVIREPREVTAGLGAYVLLLGGSVWAGLRWIFSAPRLWQLPLLLLTAPFLLAAPAGRMDSLGGALLLMAVIAAACTWQVVARRRAAVTLFLCGWLLFEGGATLRAATQEVQFEAYPAYAITPEGELYSWSSLAKGPAVYDLDRKRVRVDLGHRFRWDFTFHPHVRVPSLWDWVDRIPPYFDISPSPVWARDAVWWLNGLQRSGARDAVARWEFEDGRFVCRDRDTGAVLAGFGPDGYAEGAGATAGERFEGVAGFGHESANVVAVGGTLPTHSSYLVVPRGTFILVVGGVQDPRPADPIRVEVTWQPQRVLAHRLIPPALPLRLISLVQSRDRLKLMSDQELLASAPWDEQTERIRRSSLYWVSDDWEDVPRAAIATLVGAPHPAFANYRIRILRPEGEPIVRDIHVKPETVLEYAIAGFGGLVALLRPLPLVCASYVADAPRDFEAMASWWWLDPWFSGRRMTGWLVAALVLTALLAWWARRQALRRCATMRAVHFWTAVAVLLGPLGVIWMRLTVPWAVVEPVGDGVRAVNRDATPRNDAPWPAPAAIGTEVFVR